ncbi:amino acid adenylation domain [Serratia fonticola]|uniref:Amino acid adenylation domain n=1 Tax=Serratia fonticola TaxID=47917 RepID=A0A4U9VWB4_SERFO|nr:amino acid adenylation domain [Serratia fonticola]
MPMRLDVFCALLNGHCLHILAEHQRLDFIALSAYIRDHAIEFAFIPPALLAQNELLELSTLVVGGECLDAAMIDRYCEAGVRLINGYGLAKPPFGRRRGSINLAMPIPISARRSTTFVFICWIAICAPSHKGRLVSCISVALALGAAI